ncbi:CYFA0S02e01090g1_1 [Cyberlindnera fabianii]|uniref:CYFA0S02e01090g1_1 n=1 Tax=Cyberlindnera fabianii TaxID=36022 RepID=A0A061ALC4_CYBFA|nr:hypothetical protein BON22_4069 [Cyberlindnera fabianii]CDR38386.1 CYFA0S02e01090g1_1 [Cyberlindnera fabianii]
MLHTITVRGFQVRAFSHSRTQHAQLKKLVRKAVSRHDPRDIKKLAKKAMKEVTSNPHQKRVPQKEHKPDAALTKQHAASVLSKITGYEVDMHTLGPLSNLDVKYFKIAPRPVLYTLLGVSENQLKDSLIVDTTVQRFLKREQFEKALMTARLAKEQGSVALNNIMKRYLEEEKVNDAIDLFTWRKKWGVPVTDRTPTVLFDGCSNIRKGNAPGLTTSQAKRLKKILLSLDRVKGLKLNRTHVNSALSAMMNCEDQSIALRLFDSWYLGTEEALKGTKPNQRTYTILLKSLYMNNDKNFVLSAANMLIERAQSLPEPMKDRELYESFVFVYLKEKDPKIYKHALENVSKFFRLESIPTIATSSTSTSSTSEPLAINTIAELKEKFFPSIGLADALITKYINASDHSTALAVAREMFETYPKSVDLPFLNRYLQALSTANITDPGSQSIAIYNTTLNNPRQFSSKLEPNHITRLRVFLNIYAQSLKCMKHEGRLVVGKDEQMLFEMADGFMENTCKNATAFEVYGYTKAIRRLALTKEQRAKVLVRINRAKFKFEKERKEKFSGNKDHAKFVKKILQTEQIIKEKHELKVYLKKLDKAEIREKEASKVAVPAV